MIRPPRSSPLFPYTTLFRFIASGALLLLLPLALTPPNGMMGRRGGRCHSPPRLIYPIAALAVWHFYWQVKRDVREPLLYAGILAPLLAYRLPRCGGSGEHTSALQSPCNNVTCLLLAPKTPDYVPPSKPPTPASRSDSSANH